MLMINRFLVRFLFFISILWGLASLLFFLFFLLGDPASQLAGQRGDEKTLASIRKELHLDESISKQYFWFINDLSPIGFVDSSKKQTEILQISSGFSIKTPYFGRSFQSQRYVFDLFFEKFTGTVILAFSSLFLASIFGIFLGLLAAYKQNSTVDQSISTLAALGISAPSFFVAVICIYLFSIVLGDYTGLPVTGYMKKHDLYEDHFIWDFSSFILPCMTLAIRPLALIFQLSRSLGIDVLHADYIRTAKAKGLNDRKILWIHVLPNLFSPLLTTISGWLAALLTGSFFIEYMFDWQGIGKLTIDALMKNDFPVVMGATLISGIIFLIINSLTDILQRFFDPRIS